MECDEVIAKNGTNVTHFTIGFFGLAIARFFLAGRSVLRFPDFWKCDRDRFDRSTIHDCTRKISML